MNIFQRVRKFLTGAGPESPMEARIGGLVDAVAGVVSRLERIEVGIGELSEEVEQVKALGVQGASCVEQLSEQKERISELARGVHWGNEARGHAVQRICGVLDSIIGNQILLSYNRDIPVDVCIQLPGGARGMLPLQVAGDGRPCFRKSRTENAFLQKVFVDSLPKSGTYLIAQILDNLGFDNSGIHARMDNFYDARERLKDEFMLEVNHICPQVPYGVAAALLLPGQYMVGHMFPPIATIDHFPAFSRYSYLLSVRDTRYRLISLLRHRVRDLSNPSINAVSPDQLCILMLNDHYASQNNFITDIESILALEARGYGRMVRFEELMADERDAMRPSVESLVEITGCPENAVYDAVIKARGTETFTSTGERSRLDGIWSEEAERIFVDRGLDVLNERLGYPKHFKDYGAGA